MKLITIILFSLLSVSAFAECNREAQFIGNVRNLKVLENSFSFQVSLGRWYIASMVCPMDESEFVGAVIEIPGTPAIAEGDEISGIMVFDQKTQFYKID